MDSTIITQLPDAEQYARDRLTAEMAEHGWPEPKAIKYLAVAETIGRPCLHVSMRTAADVHRAAGLMGRVPYVDYYAAPEPGETDPAGRWYASRHTCLRINRWCGDVDLQVSVYETVDSSWAVTA